MGLGKIPELVAILVILALATGQLPRVVRKVQIAQLQLLKSSQSKSWGQAILFPQAK